MRSRLVLLFYMILLGTVAGAQQYHYNLKFRLSQKNFVDTIAIEVENDRIYLPVTINGQTYRFLLDTGASMGALYNNSPLLTAPAGHAVAVPQSVGTITSHDANGQTHSTEVFCLPDLQIGRLTISGYHANRLSRLSASNSCAGIIGFDIFNKGLLGKIDTRNRRLILTDRKNHFRYEPGFESRYQLRRHVPFVTLSPFSAHADEARFDTGDRSFFIISRQSFDAALSGFPAEVRSQIEGRTHGRHRISHFGAETTDEVVALCLRNLMWGNFSFRNVHTLTAQGPSAVGSGILDYGSVIINPHRRRLIFQPYAPSVAPTPSVGHNVSEPQSLSPHCQVNNSLPDIYYIPNRQGQPTVGLVWEQSEPYRQGFRQGDIITAVNGRPIGSVAAFTSYPFILNQTYTITVRDKGGNIRQIKLTKKQ